MGGGGDGGGGTQGCACVTHRAIPNASVTHMHTYTHTCMIVPFTMCYT